MSVTELEILALDFKTEAVLAPTFEHVDSVEGFKWTLRASSDPEFIRAVTESEKGSLVSRVASRSVDESVADALMKPQLEAIKKLREVAAASRNGDTGPVETELEAAERGAEEKRKYYMDLSSDERGDENMFDLQKKNHERDARLLSEHLVVSVEGVPGFRSKCESNHIWYAPVAKCPECSVERKSKKRCTMPKSMGPSLAYSIFMQPSSGGLSSSSGFAAYETEMLAEIYKAVEAASEAEQEVSEEQVKN